VPSTVVVAFGFEQPKVDKSKLDAIDTADGGHDAHADGHADEDPLAHGQGHKILQKAPCD